MLKKAPVLSHVYAMAAWTIKEDEKGNFRIAKTGSDDYSKPYKSLRFATNAVARFMEAEYTTRKNRRIAFYRGK